MNVVLGFFDVEKDHMVPDGVQGQNGKCGMA